MHYARANAGKLSIRTACQRIVRKRSNTTTTAARPVTCDDCKVTHFYRERRGARGLNAPHEDNDG